MGKQLQVSIQIHLRVLDDHVCNQLLIFYLKTTPQNRNFFLAKIQGYLWQKCSLSTACWAGHHTEFFHSNSFNLLVKKWKPINLNPNVVFMPEYSVTDQFFNVFKFNNILSRLSFTAVDNRFYCTWSLQQILIGILEILSIISDHISPRHADFETNFIFRKIASRIIV